MTRQQKRAELRALAKDISKVKKGTLPVGQVKSVRMRLKKLQSAGILPQPTKKPVFQRVGDFIKKFTGSHVGYHIRSDKDAKTSST